MSKWIAYADWVEPADPFGAIVFPMGGDRFYATIVQFRAGMVVPCGDIDGNGASGGLSEFHRRLGSRPFRIARPHDIVWDGGGPKAPLLPDEIVTELIGAAQAA
jgi:hypothetical protein